VGTVLEAGEGACLEDGRPLSPGQAVVVPAVLPCGECVLCRSGRDNACLAQKMPGNDFDGGFTTHMTLPARHLVPIQALPPGHALWQLAVVADAVTTPYQALVRAAVREGDPVIVIGAGGVGAFGVQIAAAFGGRVIAVDVDAVRLERAGSHGARVGVLTRGLSDEAARKAVQESAKALGFPRHGWKIFEMSGTAAGQRLAFSLVNTAGTLGIVGFTRDKLELRLSNLMAFDADAFGTWGCSPRHYPAVLDLITEGRIRVGPFVTRYPLSEINAVLEEAEAGRLQTRPVLAPDV
jgi:6-hydroxycyclohex-1-ene-1-carbonyl-CoA dehydrogenase